MLFEYDDISFQTFMAKQSRKNYFFLLNKMSCKQESLLFNMMIFQTFMAKQSHKNYFFLLISCKQVIPLWGSQNCILFVFVF